MSAAATADPPPRWPPAARDAPVFRGLEQRAIRAIEAAGALRRARPGEVIYRSGEGGESFYVVASGSVELRAVRRGEVLPSAVRTARPGDSFGEEPLVSAARRTEAIAVGDVVVAEIPVALFRRALGRLEGRADGAAAGHALAERLERTLRRGLVHDVLAASCLGRELDDDAIDVLVDAASVRRIERGEVAFEEGEPARDLLVLGEGLLQLQTTDGERVRVRGYAAAGDLVGDPAPARGARRELTAVAMGASLLASVPAEVVSTIARGAGRADLLPRLRRLARAAQEERGRIVRRAADDATMHVFRDLYRLEVARSLLVIDLETCVRCGHCAWSCGALHGTSRLVRRGDVVVTDDRADLLAGVPDASPTWVSGGGPPAAPSFDVFAEAAPRKLLLPSSCQHCENPACLVDCPTGAIGKDADGEVFVREPLCTGCGACVRACPWDNVRLDDRAPGAPRPAGIAADLVAVKCDLCRGWEGGPACVQACPVEAIARIRPLDELAELRALFGRRDASAGALRHARTRPPPWSIAAGGALVALGLGAAGASLSARGAWVPRSGPGLAAGVAAAALVGALALYAVPKRVVRLWMGRRRAAAAPPGSAAAGDASPLGPARDDRPPLRSAVRPHYHAHLAAGALAAAVAVGHAPLRGVSTVGGALLATLLATCAAGALGALAYALVPRRLARIERRPLLPEDFAGARDGLVDRLHRDLSGTSDLVKAIADRVLVPYARHPLGPLALLASGRGLREEEARLLRRVERLLEGRGKDRLGGLARLVATCVELRALPAQHGLSRLLRAVAPVHAALGAIVLALLAIHVGTVLAR
jgi:Fe-S-cluster-containing dehydrogenase component/CRP-like cAMP-binding protein